MIDSFVTYSGQEAFAATLAALRSSEMIDECFVLNMGDAEVAVDGCKTLAVDALTSTAAIKAIAEASQSKYTLIYSNGDVLKLGLHALKRMVQIADDSDAVMCYADRYQVRKGEVVKAPVIDYQQGSLRDEFDFGSVALIRTSALKQAAREMTGNYHHAGF